MKDIITITSLSKNYGEIKAVADISFSIKEGSFFAFLGPNGAGKSTTINILCTLLEKSKGSVFVDGYEIGKNDHEIRDKIGVVFQESMLDALLSVKENLETRAAFYGITGKTLEKRLDEITQATGIEKFLKRRYGQLSGGQRRRADIARALINTPKILFLDEPTTGLDPQTRKSVWNTVKKLQEEKKVTVFLTTHYMEEAAGADDVAIIDNGKIVAQGSPEQLRIKHSKDKLKIIPKDIDEYAQYLNDNGLEFKNDRGVLIISVPSSMDALKILKNSESKIENFEVVRGNMDDVFLNIAGHYIHKEDE
jgi:multidrug/hemolysin transport system ATP-binding protein